MVVVYAPDGHQGVDPPMVESISTDQRAGTITVRASNYATIEWVSEGKVVHTGPSVDLNDLSEVGGYLRAMIRGSDGFPVVGTQPFYVRSAG